MRLKYMVNQQKFTYYTLQREIEREFTIAQKKLRKELQASLADLKPDDIAVKAVPKRKHDEDAPRGSRFRGIS